MAMALATILAPRSVVNRGGLSLLCSLLTKNTCCANYLLKQHGRQQQECLREGGVVQKKDKIPVLQ